MKALVIDKIYRIITTKKILPLLILLISVHCVSAQVDTNFIFSGDTLFAHTGLKIYAGQKMIIGKASEENGWYKTIGFKSAFSFSLLFMRNIEIENNLEYKREPRKRDNDKLASSIQVGDTITIKKIKQEGNEKKGYWYLVYFKTIRFPKENLYATIVQAMQLKELIPIEKN